MRPRRWIPFAPLFLSGIIAMAGGPSGGPDLAASCEPSGVLDVSARILSLTKERSGAKVLVEVTLLSRDDLESVEIHGSAAARGRRERRFEIPERIDSLRGKTIHRVPYELELERGVEHHLYFTVRGEAPTGTPHETTAYLWVNLDPALEPEVRGNLIQYRARMSGRVEP